MVLVYIETAEGKAKNVGLEMITAAKLVSDKAVAVVIGNGNEEAVKQAATFGADEVITVASEGYNTEAYCYIMKSLVEKYSPEAVFVGSTLDGKDFAPRLAAQLGTGCVTDVVAVKVEDGKVVYTCPSYNGNLLNDMTVEGAPVVIVRSGSFKKADAAEREVTVTAEAIEVPADVMRAKIAEAVKEISETVNLEEAEVIVSGGRGMGAAENFALVKELADLLGGVVGATRAPIESGWISRAHQIGQSGKIVAPKLYIACGISGATQHVSGMIGSNYIVAINKDEDAPIFDIANVGIVGNVLDVLPLMIEEIKKARA